MHFLLGKMSPPSKRVRRPNWTTDETQLLIKVWSDSIGDLRHGKRNKHVYANMAAELQNFNVNRTPEEVHERIRTLTKKYRKERNIYINGGNEPSTWMYYNDINAFLDQISLHPGVQFDATDAGNGTDCGEETDSSEASESFYGSSTIYNMIESGFTQDLETNTEARTSFCLEASSTPHAADAAICNAVGRAPSNGIADRKRKKITVDRNTDAAENTPERRNRLTDSLLRVMEDMASTHRTLINRLLESTHPQSQQPVPLADQKRQEFDSSRRYMKPNHSLPIPGCTLNGSSEPGELVISTVRSETCPPTHTSVETRDDQTNSGRPLSPSSASWVQSELQNIQIAVSGNQPVTAVRRLVRELNEFLNRRT